MYHISILRVLTTAIENDLSERTYHFILQMCRYADQNSYKFLSSIVYNQAGTAW